MTTMKKPAHPFIDRGFLTIKPEGDSQYQGRIIAEIGDGFFVAQLYEWFMGVATRQYVYHVSEFAESHENGEKKFKFFDSDEHRNSYYNNYQGRRNDQIRKTESSVQPVGDATAE